MTEISSFEFAVRQPTRLRDALDTAAVFDRLIAICLLPLVILCLALLLPVLLLVQGRPFLFSSERMVTPERAFKLWKIRTMQVTQGCQCSVLGGDMAGSVTPLGRLLRRFRLDELPQIFNVMKGDIRFIGPRPPLRRYVEAYPELYARVLLSKPGITGLATVMLHRREDRILSRCRTREESDKAYRNFCILPKARLDLLYQRRRSLGLDVLILFRTFARLKNKR